MVADARHLTRKRRGFRRTGRFAPAVAFAALAVGACEVGPDFKSPEAPDVKLTSGSLPAPGKTAGDHQHFARGRDIPGEWWTLFRSKPLNTLIERALADNHDLAAAQAALRVAHANYEAARGAFWPQVGLSDQSERGKTSVDVSSPVNTASDYYTLHTKQVQATYAPDVFGGVRRAVENAEALRENQGYQLEATYLTLTSNIALAAVQEASLRGQVRTTETILSSQRDLLGLLRKQLSLGQVAEVDVALQEGFVAQAQLTLVPLQKQLAINRDLLVALTGHLAGEGLPERFVLSDMALPQTLPASLPSEIVRHRPDVMAAEANVHAASALIGVAVANRLPQFQILGNFGKQATDFHNLFLGGGAYTFWTVAGSVMQPLFDGFTLEQKQRAAEAGFYQALEQYRSTVVLAFQNVADALQALEYDARQLAAAKASERASAKSLRLVREQFKLGQVSSIDVINVMQANFQAQLAVVQSRANRLSDVVALFQALGGGWWNRDDAAPRPGRPTGWLTDIVNARYDRVPLKTD